LKFEYDSGNILKSLVKHGITKVEAESVFQDPDKIIAYDSKHSTHEIRYICVGESFMARVLYIAFQLRSGKIRIISARVANNKTRKLYETQ